MQWLFLFFVNSFILFDQFTYLIRKLKNHPLFFSLLNGTIPIKANLYFARNRPHIDD